jgi:hypothetical protein
MANPSDKMEGKSRWEEAQEFTEGFARYAAQHDDDGITLIKFNSHAKIFDGVTADKVHDCSPRTSRAAAPTWRRHWPKP